MRNSQRCIVSAILISVTGIASVAAAESGDLECGRLVNHFGPFDYRTAPPETRALVERVHFTPKVESLRGGNTSPTPGGDMAYTLNVFPNHHRALMALIKLARKEKTNRPRDMGYSVECRFDRAERFRPDDAVVWMLHGIYLAQNGKSAEAVEKFEASLKLAGDDANTQYNLGLAYFDLKQYDKALESAHHAYRLGFPLPGLRDMLQRVGKWRDASSTKDSPSAPGVSEAKIDAPIPSQQKGN